MLWILSLCAFIGTGILWVMGRRESARFGRVHLMATTLNCSVPAHATSSNTRDEANERMEKALLMWRTERAERELSVRPSVYEAPDPVAPAPEPEVPAVPPVVVETVPEPPSAVDEQAEEPPAEDVGGAAFTIPPRDHYDVLQISPDADMETIHRVYRIMASRFHPDNQVTGDIERFLLLTEAHKVLSDPERRRQYDGSIGLAAPGALPIFGMKVFLDGVEGENNRRLGVLSLLYHRRRLNDSQPGVSLLELERRMAFPREYLVFTVWYLRAKGYISVMEENSDYALTALGVDYVEAHASTNPVIRELLTAGSGSGPGSGGGQTPEAPRCDKCDRREHNRRHRGKRRGNRGAGTGSICRRPGRDKGNE